MDIVFLQAVCQAMFCKEGFTQHKPVTFPSQEYIKTRGDDLGVEKSLCQHITSHCLRMVRVMPVPISALLLLHRPGSELAAGFGNVREGVVARRWDLGFSGSDADAVERAVSDDCLRRVSTIGENRKFL